MAAKARITVSRDACLHKIPSKQYWFDKDVANRIRKEQMTLALNPSGQGLMIVERNGHSTNAGAPGDRSISLLVTGERYARRYDSAGQTNYTRAAFMKKKPKRVGKSVSATTTSSTTHLARSNGIEHLPVKYEKPIEAVELVTVMVNGHAVSGTIDTIKKLLNLS